MYQTEQELVVFRGSRHAACIHGSYRRRPRVRCPQRVEQILGRHPAHGRRSIRPISLWRLHVPLASALDLVQDDTGDDDEENAPKCEAE